MNDIQHLTDLRRPLYARSLEVYSPGQSILEAMRVGTFIGLNPDVETHVTITFLLRKYVGQ